MYRNVLDILEQSAARYAQKTAAKDQSEQCSFEELLVHSRGIGSALCACRVSGQIVPVYMENSVLALKAFFGIVYAGGGYSFLNPVQPAQRLETILHVLDAPVVITDAAHAPALEKLSFGGKVLLAEELLNFPADEAALARIRAQATDLDPLYVNFTSGSTGVPKGVVVGHRSVLDFIRSFVSIFGITAADTIGNQAPFDFDVSVKDIYSMLLTGATLYIIPRESFSFPKRVLDCLVEERVTTLIWAVSALCMITSLKGFSYKVPDTVNKVLFSGEVMPLRHLREWRRALPGAMFVNLYGPTEITCNCTYFVVDEASMQGPCIPIGKSFPNERVFLLDEQQREIHDPEKEGELCVSGAGLALGYFRDKERTAAAFPQNPLHDRYHERIYRTGDVAKYREDGNLVYVGRKDFQIKHLGHRIELFEIDAHIGAVPGVERVCCLYDEEKKQIVAVYQGDADKAAIKAELKQKVIRYMIPDRFTRIDRMPMTANGKIDRKKLKETCLEG